MTSIRGTAHPYYGAEAFGDGYSEMFETLDGLIENVNSSDGDLNFVYRWDWYIPDPDDVRIYKEEGEEPPVESLKLFVVLQRKSRFLNWSAPVGPGDEEKVRAFLASDRILGTVRRTWAPLLDAPSDEDVNRLAQTFYEASGIKLPSMTDKPMIVRGLHAVFERLGRGMSA